MNKKILCIGNAAYDITLPVADFPIQNTKSRVSNKISCGGGPAANAAYLLGKWGMDVYFLGIVGNDLYGAKIKEELKSANVNIDYLQTHSTFETTLGIVIANTRNGTRTVLSYRNPDLYMDDIDIDFVPDLILLDGQEYEMSNKLIDKYPKAISIIDAGRNTKEIITLCDKVDYVVCSLNFALEITGLNIDYDDNCTLINLYKKIDQMYKGIIIITLEDKGCLFKDEVGNVKIVPSLKVKAIDSTGAGDIFHGVFTYGVARNLPLVEILKISNIAGALSVTKLGVKNSIPSKEEVRKVYYGIK